jgi:ankyrin repeat protein
MNFDSLFQHAQDLIFAVSIQSLAIAKTSSNTKSEEIAFVLNTPVKDQHFRTLLHLACLNGYIESVKILLSFSRIQLNSTDYQGATPLELACFVGNLEITELLVKRGAKIPQSIKFMVDKIPRRLSIRGKQIYDEIETKKVEGFSSSTERYELTQTYISIKEEFAHISRLISENTIPNQPVIATPYYSILKKPIGYGKPETLSLPFENELIRMLEL